MPSERLPLAKRRRLLSLPPPPLPRRRPGAVGPGPRQRALRQRGRRDGGRGAQRQLLGGRGGAALPRHQGGEPLRPAAVTLLHHLGARPHPPAQQPGLQHGQSGGAERTRRGGAGPQGHGGGPDL